MGCKECGWFGQVGLGLLLFRLFLRRSGKKWISLRIINFYFFNGPELRMEALVFPAFAYPEKPTADVTILETFFGYMETPKLLAWMEGKRADEKKNRKDFLKTDYLEKLAEEKKEARGY
jgi:hypothetical protein